MRQLLLAQGKCGGRCVISNAFVFIQLLSVFSEVEGAVRSVVVDGVTVGRPCCGVHDCQERLATVKSRFCQKHIELNHRCCVKDCKASVDIGFQTCAKPEHRKLELHAHEENRAMFQLKRRLERSGASPTDVASNSVASEAEADDPPPLAEILDQDVEGEPSGAQCKGKKAAGNRPPKARFGRRRTHNEELAVASCGVILGRATFYGSEAPNGVRVRCLLKCLCHQYLCLPPQHQDFLKGLFPTKESLPQVIWHDNNCQILSMLQHVEEGEDRDFFSDCAMPVDVFHFKSKHKETDVQCNINCNPANWPDLVTEEGRWRFNSSAAEQANCWFGRYLPIVREMEAIRYDFFLDEMILRHNRNLVEELDARGLFPYNIPREALLC